MREAAIQQQIVVGEVLGEKQRFAWYSRYLWTELNLLIYKRGFGNTITISREYLMRTARLAHSEQAVTTIFDTFVRDYTQTGLLKVEPSGKRFTFTVTDLNEWKYPYDDEDDEEANDNAQT